MDRSEYQERLGHRLCELDVWTEGIRPEVARGPAKFTRHSAVPRHAHNTTCPYRCRPTVKAAAAVARAPLAGLCPDSSVITSEQYERFPAGDSAAAARIVECC